VWWAWWGCADITTKELIALNHDINAKDLKAGQTIILPANKLSKRDKEILAGIGKGKYRTYPVRAGETISDIISKRKISRAEVDELNPDVNLNKLSGTQ
jgi:LysM domain